MRSSIRDATGFIEFGDFRDQTEYGKVASEINKKVVADLESLDTASLEGQRSRPDRCSHHSHLQPARHRRERADDRAHQGRGPVTAPAGASMDGPTALSLSVPMRAEHVTKVFPGTTALDDVSFDVQEGRVNVLVGENGAGKSTLMKILAGVEQPTEGQVLMDGKPVVLPSVTAAADHGVGIIFQELNLCPNLSVLDNLFLAQEIVRGGVIDTKAEKRAGASSCWSASSRISTPTSWSATCASDSSRSSRSPRRSRATCGC